jgi:hypothetical protein
MDERWRILKRVRDLRARLALNEVSQRRQTLARVQSMLEEARLCLSRLEQQATQASTVLAAYTCDGESAMFNAAEANALLSYVTSVRLKVQEAATPVRRAQLQCDRAQAAAEEAAAKYRQEAARNETVQSQWQSKLKAFQRLEFDREDEARAEERAGARIARRMTADNTGDGDE